MQDPIERQVAIDEISQYASIWMEYDTTMSLEEVAEAALKAAKRTMVHILEELPSIQSSFSRDHENDRSAEPCEDAVSRADMLNELDGWIEGFDANCHKESFADMKLVRSSMSKLPSVTPKPFHNITMREVLTYIDGMPEDVWQEFTACLECRGWSLERKTAKWCGSDFA